MPTYDYRCESCGHELEQFQSITAKPLRKCPACGRLRLKRLIGTGAGIIFKGSGFYETDYRSDNYKKQAKADQDQTSDKSESSSPRSNNGSGNEQTTGKNESGGESKTENQSAGQGGTDGGDKKSTRKNPSDKD